MQSPLWMPDPDLLDGLLAESVPWLQAWAVLLALLLASVVVPAVIDVCRTPHAKPIRKRFG